MRKYLLDTNICIHFLKGEFNLKEKLKEIGIENCYVSELSILELPYGVERSSAVKKEHNRSVFNNFYNFIATNIISINTCFEIYAKEKTRLKMQGKLISEFDMLIGCSAIAGNFTLVTRNVKHFESLQNIQIENWINT